MASINPRRLGGFTLIEVLVALLIATAALTLGLGLALQQRRLDQKLRADEIAMRAMEASLESIRAGAIPLQSGPLLPPVAYPSEPISQDLHLSLVVQAVTTPNLFEIDIDAVYPVRQGLRHRTLRSMVWRP
ncbi:MAG: prepilin-type N-terminal cleavage/methylation domain-containing protein [Thermoanaerobaculia bacterium]